MEVEAAARLSTLLADGAAVVVATHDNDLVPHVTRGWGGVLSPEDGRLDLCLTVSGELGVIADLEANGAIAVTLAHPTTYLAMQVTGVVEWIGDVTLDDEQRIAAHVRSFTEKVSHIGLPPAVARIAGSHFVAVRIAVQQCFEQTPGSTAGTPL